jgi:hypothetical protein
VRTRRSTHLRQNSDFRERRGPLRFPIQSEVHYKVYHRAGKPLCSGRGWTIDMSSKAILISADAPLPLGKGVKLSIDWPAKLNNTCRLQLVTSGRIIRTEGNNAVVSLATHEFRTKGTNGLLPLSRSPQTPKLACED